MKNEGKLNDNTVSMTFKDTSEGRVSLILV